MLGKPSALIFDRDGTLNAMVLNTRGEPDSPYFASQLELYPDLGKWLFPLRNLPLFIATNQPGIAKGHFNLKDLETLNDELAFRLKPLEVQFKEIATCLHHPTGAPQGDSRLIRPCDCRKPRPGLLTYLCHRHQLLHKTTYFIGDTRRDELAAQAAGLPFLAVQTYFSPLVPAEKQSIDFPTAPTLDQVLRALASSMGQHS